MEKYIFVLSSALVLVALLNISAVVAHPRAHPNFPHFDECKTSEQPTDEDLKSMRDPNTPKSKTAKCFMTCLGEKSGKLVGGQINREGVINFMKKTPNYTEQTEQIITEVIEECKNVSDPDRCENGYKKMECMKENGMKRGLKPPHPPKGQPPNGQAPQQ